MKHLFLLWCLAPVQESSAQQDIAAHIWQLTYNSIIAEFRLDTAAIAPLMDEQFISIYPHKTLTKQEELAGMYQMEVNRRKEAHVVRRLLLENFQVRVFDETVIATYFSVTEGTKGGKPFQNRRMRWYDVWVKRSGEWKWVSSQGTWINP